MKSTQFFTAALLSVCAFSAAKPALANTLPGLSDLTTYSVYNPDGFTNVDSSNLASFGAIGQEGSLTTTATDSVGGIVTLSFELSSDGGTPNDFSAVVNGVALFSGTDIPFEDVSETVTFAATGSDTLSFVGRDDPGFLDLSNVSATEASAVTPEPSSLALLGTGLLGAVGMMKRRLA